MMSNVIFYVSESLLLAIVIVLVLRLITKSKVHGKMVVIKREDGGKTFSLELDEDPERLAKLDSVTFKVVEEEP